MDGEKAAAIVRIVRMKVDPRGPSKKFDAESETCS